MSRRLSAVSVTSLAGYRELRWDGLQPRENLLVGRNGAGKSSLVEAIVVGLNFLYGKRSGDLLAGANESSYLNLRFEDGSELLETLGAIRSSQTPEGSERVTNVLYIHEARRPKSRVGRFGHSEITQHPTRRYEYVLRELQLLLRGDDSQRIWAETLLERVARLTHAGTAASWAWLGRQLPSAGPHTARPVSCGQYDVLALFLDAFRTKEAVALSGRQPYVILDNPEAFLHPALQEELLEFLRVTLPQAQFIMASHSLKLLARAQPSSVFWLSREHMDGHGRLTVVPVRELSPQDGGAFFDLYGYDTSSAVLAMT